MEEIKALTLSDFAVKEIKRTGKTAEVIFDYYQGDLDKPVRLLGFSTDAMQSDWDIRESAFYYWQDLIHNSQRLNQA